MHNIADPAAAGAAVAGMQIDLAVHMVEDNSCHRQDTTPVVVDAVDVVAAVDDSHGNCHRRQHHCQEKRRRQLRPCSRSKRRRRQQLQLSRAPTGQGNRTSS